MSGVSSLTVFLYAISLIIIILIIRLFEKPIKYLLKLITNSAISFILILLINTLCAGFGFQIAANAVTLTLCGFLGVSGVGLLVLFNFII